MLIAVCTFHTKSSLTVAVEAVGDTMVGYIVVYIGEHKITP